MYLRNYVLTYQCTNLTMYILVEPTYLPSSVPSAAFCFSFYAFTLHATIYIQSSGYIQTYSYTQTRKHTYTPKHKHTKINASAMAHTASYKLVREKEGEKEVLVETGFRLRSTIERVKAHTTKHTSTR